MYNDSLISRHVLGYDEIFKRIRDLTKQSHSSYPPYNLKKDGDKFYIELAVAGLSKEDLQIEIDEGVLSIKHTAKKSDQDYIYCGIAQRSFEQKFTLAEYIEVVNAELKNGLLILELEKNIPEDKRPKTVKIN